MNLEKIKTQEIDGLKLIFAILSGLLLTGAFPKIGLGWLAWFALVPLLVAIKYLPPGKSFVVGFVSGFVHYFTLLYWVVYTMQTYGNLPLILSLFILILLSAFLALFVASFSLMLAGFSTTPAVYFGLTPVLWVSSEILRSFLFSGFPWELIGYSQYQNLHIIQISDIFGVYGVSFILTLANGVVVLIITYVSDRDFRVTGISKILTAGCTFACLLVLFFAWVYGNGRIHSIDNEIVLSPAASVSIVQGNIDQAHKWDPEFQFATVEKYIKLSQVAASHQTDLIVWPETATPFYFLNNLRLSGVIINGIGSAEADFLIGSPSFSRTESGTAHYNSAYLINSGGEVYGKYDKAHLVPFGEYVPFKKWLPFIGKMVEAVGDFSAGQKGNTIDWRQYKLGVQICYEIIFPNLSRALVRNDADLLINITNDAWYGPSSAPYQHFSMAIFRAVENRRALVRSANTGISGFIDPVGRIMVSTPIFEDRVETSTVPILKTRTFYTRFGDLFAYACLVVSLGFILSGAIRSARN
ncbi:apolipoprotein N-acyltransferase [Thermodesulfobacteriota bacterium]